MRQATVSVHGREAGTLVESPASGDAYVFTYHEGYPGPPVSLTMPVRAEPYRFDRFPPFFDGLLPEGVMLDALLRTAKLDRDDCFGQLLVVGADLVGAVTVTQAPQDVP